VKYKINETRDIVTRLGYVSTAKVGNVYLTGNAAGLIDDFWVLAPLTPLKAEFLRQRQS